MLSLCWDDWEGGAKELVDENHGTSYIKGKGLREVRQ